MSEMISVNGVLQPLNYLKLFDLLEDSGVDGRQGGVAVALNGEVVPRADWAQTSLKSNDKVEIVQIVRGG